MGLIIAVIMIIAIKAVWENIKSRFQTPEFKGKRIWITGGSSGIGEEMAKQFIKLGAEEVIISARKTQELERVKSECADPKRVTVLSLDMSRTQDIFEKTENFIKNFEKAGKKLDIIVQNAGVSQRSLFQDYDYANHEYMTQLNYHGPVALTKALLPHFIANKSGQIVIINSIAGLLTPGMRASYVGSKHALTGFFGSLRTELRDFNINVTQIYPGYVQTNVSTNALTGSKGQSLGKVDTNIKNGEKVDTFTQQALLAIYQKKNDAVISKDLKHHLGIALRSIFPDFVHNLTYKNLKNQKDAVENSQ